MFVTPSFMYLIFERNYRNEQEIINKYIVIMNAKRKRSIRFMRKDKIC